MIDPPANLPAGEASASGGEASEPLDLNISLCEPFDLDLDLNLGPAAPFSAPPPPPDFIDLVSDESEPEPTGLGRRRYTSSEKGKRPLIADPIDDSLVDFEAPWLSIAAPAFESDEEEMEQYHHPPPVPYHDGEWRREKRRRDDRDMALRLAPKFAVSSKEEIAADVLANIAQVYDRLVAEPEPPADGPFFDAKKIVEGRKGKLQWAPSRGDEFWSVRRWVPSLKELCMRNLVEFAEELESLEGVPDLLRHTLVSELCGRRKMSCYVLGLYVVGSPTEVRVPDCSWAAEEQFEKVLAGLDCHQLKVLQFEHCGRCVTDYVLRATLAKSSNSLLSLSTVSLKGAYRLSDAGLDALISSAPLLRSVNLSQCSLLTSDGIISVIVKLMSVLRELYLDDCQDVDALLILPALKQLKFLEVLSVARIQNVCDQFVCDLLCVCGASIKELGLADCQKLSNHSMKAIGTKCPHLCTLNIQNINQLNDSALIWLSDGCRSIQRLKLQRNSFSDIAIATFLEASGDSLTELSLNSVQKIAEHTALAISLRCALSLQNLDLSFCRNLTDEALGLIVDSCSSLTSLKLFGCSQISKLFLNGHSNPRVDIVGAVDGPTLEELKLPDFL